MLKLDVDIPVTESTRQGKQIKLVSNWCKKQKTATLFYQTKPVKLLQETSHEILNKTNELSV